MDAPESHCVIERQIEELLPIAEVGIENFLARRLLPTLRSPNGSRARPQLDFLKVHANLRILGDGVSVKKQIEEIVI